MKTFNPTLAIPYIASEELFIPSPWSQDPSATDNTSVVADASITPDGANVNLKVQDGWRWIQLGDPTHIYSYARTEINLTNQIGFTVFPAGVVTTFEWQGYFTTGLPAVLSGEPFVAPFQIHHQGGGSPPYALEVDTSNHLLYLYIHNINGTFNRRELLGDFNDLVNVSTNIKANYKPNSATGIADGSMQILINNVEVFSETGVENCVVQNHDYAKVGIYDYTNAIVDPSNPGRGQSLEMVVENFSVYLAATPTRTHIDTSQAGVPVGGTAGQFLQKNSTTNFDYSWATASGLTTIYSGDGTLASNRTVTMGGKSISFFDDTNGDFSGLYIDPTTYITHLGGSTGAGAVNIELDANSGTATVNNGTLVVNNALLASFMTSGTDQMVAVDPSGYMYSTSFPISSINTDTTSAQTLTTGTSGTNFTIDDDGVGGHVFNLPVASGTNTGKLSNTDWTTFNSKQGAITLTTTGTSGASTLIGNTLNIPQYGSVTSVALSLPSFITVSGSPITTTGTLTGTLATQSANLVFAGPSSGSPAAPTFRALVAADIPGSVSPITVVNTTSLFSTGLPSPAGLTSTSINSVMLGSDAGNASSGSNSVVFIGQSAGFQVSSGSNMVAIGNNSGNRATNSSNAVFIGTSAGFTATNVPTSQFIGYFSGYNATNANNSTFMGATTGQDATNADHSNFIGSRAGLSASNASYSNLFGWQVGSSFTANNIGANNIIIGTNISLANATANGINIGGVLFGTNTYATVGTGTTPSITAVSNGSIGIGVVPASITARLHLPAGTATANTAPLKIPSGTLLTTPEPGAIESDGTHLYWTDAGGTRRQLD